MQTCCHGDIKTYEFSVSNYDEVNTNEVLMKYYLEVTTEATNSPLEVTIQNETTGETLTLNNGRTDEFELPYETKITYNYKLVLNWDESKKDSSYAGLNLKYTVKLVATQKRMKVR